MENNDQNMNFDGKRPLSLSDIEGDNNAVAQDQAFQPSADEAAKNKKARAKKMAIILVMIASASGAGWAYLSMSSPQQTLLGKAAAPMTLTTPAPVPAPLPATLAQPATAPASVQPAVAAPPTQTAPAATITPAPKTAINAQPMPANTAASVAPAQGGANQVAATKTTDVDYALEGDSFIKEVAKRKKAKILAQIDAEIAELKAKTEKSRREASGKETGGSSRSSASFPRELPPVPSTPPVAPSAPGINAKSVAEPAASAQQPLPKLIGVNSSSHAAVLKMDGGYFTVYEGDSVGDYRVVSIKSGSLTFADNKGQRKAIYLSGESSKDKERKEGAQ